MASRGDRNNNPGNIEYGPFARAHGATGSDGRFAIFPTPEAGISAIKALQQSYEKKGLTSVQERINRWAPSFENNVSAYANAVAGGMGIDRNAPFSFVDSNLDDDTDFVLSMIRHENGYQPYTRDQVRAALGGGDNSKLAGYFQDLAAKNPTKKAAGDGLFGLANAAAKNKGKQGFLSRAMNAAVDFVSPNVAAARDATTEAAKHAGLTKALLGDNPATLATSFGGGRGALMYNAAGQLVNVPFTRSANKAGSTSLVYTTPSGKTVSSYMDPYGNAYGSPSLSANYGMNPAPVRASPTAIARAPAPARVSSGYAGYIPGGLFGVPSTRIAAAPAKTTAYGGYIPGGNSYLSPIKSASTGGLTRISTGAGGSAWVATPSSLSSNYSAPTTVSRATSTPSSGFRTISTGAGGTALVAYR